MYVMLIYTTSVINVMVSVLASSAFGSKPKTVKLVFADSLLSTQFQGVRTKTGCLGIRTMCQR
jgi:hypothetical protein